MTLSVGDPDGFGRYGIVSETVDGLLCHDCGHHYAHLGLHAYRAHGTTADDYRAAHGLGRTGLVIEATRATITDNARRALPGKDAFLAARDPAAASRAQRRGSQAISAAGMHAILVSARIRKGHARAGPARAPSSSAAGAELSSVPSSTLSNGSTAPEPVPEEPRARSPCQSPTLAAVEDELRAAVQPARDAVTPGPSSVQPGPTREA